MYILLTLAWSLPVADLRGLLPGPRCGHRGDERGAGAVRRGLDQEGGAAIADQLGLGGAHTGQAA